MTTSDLIASAALGVSLLSILISIYLHDKDRGRIQAKAILNYGDPEDMHRPLLEIRIVNIGRRPILLEWLMVDFERAPCQGMPLADRMPLRLEEGESFERTIRPTDPILFDSRNDYATDVHIVDTLSREYKVKDAMRLLLEYQQIYREEITAWRGT